MDRIKIKALAVDLDGTLLGKDESISPENLEALNMLREKNIEVIPVTGRPYVLARKILGKHNVKVNHIICSNGGITYDADGNKTASYYMNKESGYELLSYLEDLKNITIGQSAFNNIEANSPDSNKGQALKKLLEILDIKIDEVMAIGDNTNDLAMLNIVPHSVAMGNAHDEIKKVCKFVTKNNDESGVAHAINSFINTD